MESWLANASLPLVLLGLLIAGFGVPLPEDPLLLTAGVLAHAQGIPLWATILIGGGTVLVADFMLFSIARHLGPNVQKRGLFRRLLPPPRRAKLERMLARRGDVIVFIARHLPGLRGPIFVLVGAHGMRPSRFILWDTLGLCITSPLVVSAGWLGSAHIDLVRKNLAKVEHWVAAGLVVAAGIGWGVYAWRKRRKMDRDEQGSNAEDQPRQGSTTNPSSMRTK